MAVVLRLSQERLSPTADNSATVDVRSLTDWPEKLHNLPSGSVV